MRLLEPINLGKRLKFRTGDTLAYRIQGVYGFARVVRTELTLAGQNAYTLLYFYRPRSTSLDELPPLHKEDLIIPPLITLTPWLQIFITVVRSTGLGPEDRFARHCFKRGDLKLGDRYETYVDEEGRPLPARFEPCGRYAIHSLQGIETALGLELALVKSIDEYSLLEYRDYRLSRRRSVPHTYLEFSASLEDMANAGTSPGAMETSLFVWMQFNGPARIVRAWLDGAVWRLVFDTTAESVEKLIRTNSKELHKRHGQDYAFGWRTGGEELLT